MHLLPCDRCLQACSTAARTQQGVLRARRVETAMTLARNCRVDTAGTMQCVVQMVQAHSPACVTRSACPTPRLSFAIVALPDPLPDRLANTTHAVAASTRRWRLTSRCPQGGIHAALPALPVCLPLSRSRLPGLFDERHARS
ncbi:MULTISPECIES: hypothetical protein [Xanthomonas]|uniref:hypothetical protein n=1 Tax=Xanthomonas TaxID=338 RepID=UPI0014701D7C|nr:hypothetical protein [Xanthomonas phaseoli]MBO9779462.1 hypothetical protein [Xanthomonas phaseoli pv. dieffenbachiae]MBO9786590.1 hypothetical protein [Xanthomonas phaseoli pv. dieffenbachiae]MBO9795414.1 hypothetical protein [Xanthomonas phaseoli pv. dieffenbachiae]MBO9811507.1 hypothetical protein [Xanthomonas phaseoli pv. dieffenbachiae]MBO9819506.1 hypothetical protein [Xanthomonas phaseoli pv. dieffenbachiae]